MTVKKELWLVHGITGRWDDRVEWVVCAYKKREDAELHASKATEAAVQFKKNNGRYARYPTPQDNPYDPGMRMDGDTDYVVAGPFLMMDPASDVPKILLERWTWEREKRTNEELQKHRSPV